MSKKSREERKRKRHKRHDERVHKRHERHEHRVKRRRDAFKRLKDQINKVGFAVLMPFKGAMVKVLQKRGMNVSMNDKIAKIAIMFHDSKIANKHSFDLRSYDALNHADPVDDGIAAAATASGFPVSPQEVDMVKKIIAQIIDFFKHMKDKKDNGEALSEEDKVIADKADEVKKDVDATPEKSHGGNIISNLFANLLGIFRPH